MLCLVVYRGKSKDSYVVLFSCCVVSCCGWCCCLVVLCPVVVGVAVLLCFALLSYALLCCVLCIHSKSGKVCGVCFSDTKKSAEKVRKSRHENFATKVRKSIKSLKMHHLKAKCIKI